VADLRIFSYLPNPRIWKATIAARLNGVEIEIRGTKPADLPSWLWDFDARPLTDEDRAIHGEQTAHTGFSGGLVKTAAFLEANPYGTVPVAFSPDGAVGIFESNAIMRAVARLGDPAAGLYGADAYQAARIDAFLDVSLVFARDSQCYLLALTEGRPDVDTLADARESFRVYMAGIEQALSHGQFCLVGTSLTLADICFACELVQFSRERASIARIGEPDLQPIFDPNYTDQFPSALAHFDRLVEHQAFAPDVKPFLERVDSAVRRAADS